MSVRSRLSLLHAADLGRAPNLISMLRLPLAALFPLVADDAPRALAVLAAAGLTDVLDGWLARRSGQTSAMGAVVDPIADKVFAATVVVTLLYQGRMPGWALPALLSREILEAPLVAWVLWKQRRSERRANVPGKVATMVQFAAVLTAIAAPALVSAALVAAAVTGGAAGVSYWARELGRARRLPVPEQAQRA